MVRSIVLLIAIVGTSCVRVRPHERQDLSRRSMTMDRGMGEERADHHRSGAREGAEGGNGTPGGGCGCN